MRVSWISLSMAVCASLLLPGCSGSPKGVRIVHVTTVTDTKAEPGLGYQLRPRVDAMTELVKQKELNEALEEAGALIDEFKALFDPTRGQRVFNYRAEFEAYQATVETPIEWVDISYGQILQTVAFIFVEIERTQEALGVLGRLCEVAPYDAGARAERGAALVKERKFERALASFREALELARTHSSQRPVAAPALRGIGFNLIELGQLDEARSALEESLNLEPGNEIAENELRYLDKLQARKADAPSGVLTEQSLKFGPWETAEDFKRDEPVIVKMISWLAQHPFPEGTQTRKDTAEIVLQWVIEAPHVKVELPLELMSLLAGKESYAYAKPIYTTFFFSMVRYAIDHGGKAGGAQSAVVATRASLEMYRRIKAKKGGENTVLEEVAALDARGKLEVWVAARLPSQDAESIKLAP